MNVFGVNEIMKLGCYINEELKLSRGQRTEEVLVQSDL